MLKFHRHVRVEVSEHGAGGGLPASMMVPVVMTLRGSAIAEALLGDVEEMASVINHLSMAGDTALPEDMAAYVPRPHRVICAEYLELIAQKLREEQD